MPVLWWQNTGRRIDECEYDLRADGASQHRGGGTHCNDHTKSAQTCCASAEPGVSAGAGVCGRNFSLHRGGCVRLTTATRSKHTNPVRNPYCAGSGVSAEQEVAAAARHFGEVVAPATTAARSSAPTQSGNLSCADSGVSAEQESAAAARHFGEVVAYATTASCRRRALLLHFGEKLPPGRCAGCDVCDDVVAVEQQVRGGSGPRTRVGTET